MVSDDKIRTVVYFSKEQRDALERLSAKSGAPMGEIVRRAVAAWIKDKEGKKK